MNATPTPFAGADELNNLIAAVWNDTIEHEQQKRLDELLSDERSGARAILGMYGHARESYVAISRRTGPDIALAKGRVRIATAIWFPAQCHPRTLPSYFFGMVGGLSNCDSDLRNGSFDLRVHLCISSDSSCDGSLCRQVGEQ